MEEKNLNQPKRPAMLKVLCILTFVGAGFFILTGLLGIFNFTMSEEDIMQRYDMMVKFNPDLDYESFEQSIQDQGYQSILGSFYNLLTLMGAIMMWKLNKKGFIIYIVAELLPYTSFLLFNQSSGSNMAINIGGLDMKTITIIATVLMVTFDLLFFFLYFKALKKIEPEGNGLA